MKILPLALFAAIGLFCLPAQADSLTRAEALRIAEAFLNYRWTATDKNVLHGKDRDGITVETPNNQPGVEADPKLWVAGATNTGMPYKWGGFDSLESFEKGIKAGKAGGDMYNPDKRKTVNAVSSAAVGIDCSGFISRCWKLSEKHSTETLPDLCTKLSSVADLKPGDIMNASGGHVIMFAKWLDAEKTNALFYESSPYCKVTTNTYSPASLAAEGYKPLRYKLIVD